MSENNGTQTTSQVVAASPYTVSDQDFLKVIGDFLEQGHVDTILSVFRQDPRYYGWTGALLNDERFAVRLGVSVLMETLVAEDPHQARLAIPSLVRELGNEIEWVRGEAVSVLGMLGGPEVLEHVRRLGDDPSPQVREIVADILAGDS